MRKRLGFGKHTSCYKLIMLRSKPNATSNKPSRCTSIFLVVGLCCCFFEFGAWQMGGFRGDTPAIILNRMSNCTILPDLFDTHHRKWAHHYDETLDRNIKVFEACDAGYMDYTPCQAKKKAMNFPRENMTNRERHCPSENEKLYCLIPAPEGYLTPFSWPKCRVYVPYANVPYKSLIVEKAAQNWILLEGNLFKFLEGGTMFPKGADAYIDELASVIPIASGTIRTALDIECGVASWGAYLFKRNVLAMSFASGYSDEAQVQFALERGVPAVIGVLGTMKLPYPSRSFDMAHCSHCQIPWTANDGIYLMEVDRVLRPGGYWILSGPPINWKTYYRTWNQSKDDVEKEQRSIEDLAKLLCWDKLYEKGDIAIWKKKPNTFSCPKRQDNNSVKICDPEKVDDVWYKKMSACVTPLPEVSSPDEVAGGQLKKFPYRLSAVPPRIAGGYIRVVTERTYSDDNRLWRKHVTAYKKINKFIGTVRYRNMMDMNAGLGGFAAAIDSPNSWVMNVVPTISQNDSLGIIYERGLIGIYHDWCEAFSTYPRTYDFIHANGIFSLYRNKCKMEDILLEMDRILRPEGAVVFRDNEEVLREVMRTATGMRWKVKMLEHEDGPHLPEKILLAVKRYWVMKAE